jgi:sulfite reductase beta subunit-like hemoprotein
VGDIGLAGAKVKVGGRTTDGYQLFLGADLGARVVGEVVGRVGAADVPAAVEVVVGIWESMRHGGETLGQTVNRVGHEAFAAHIEAVMQERWGSGPEPSADPEPEPLAAAEPVLAAAAAAAGPAT